jgi:hypothetical protein
MASEYTDTLLLTIRVLQLVGGKRLKSFTPASTRPTGDIENRRRKTTRRTWQGRKAEGRKAEGRKAGIQGRKGRRREGRRFEGWKAGRLEGWKL